MKKKRKKPCTEYAVQLYIDSMAKGATRSAYRSLGQALKLFYLAQVLLISLDDLLENAGNLLLVRIFFETLLLP